jgi:hypothetical protein
MLSDTAYLASLVSAVRAKDRIGHRQCTPCRVDLDRSVSSVLSMRYREQMHWTCLYRYRWMAGSQLAAERRLPLHIDEHVC